MMLDFLADPYKCRRFTYFGPRRAELVNFSVETESIIDDGERSYCALVVSSMDHGDGTMSIELVQTGAPLRERIPGALPVVRAVPDPSPSPTG